LIIAATVGSSEIRWKSLEEKHEQDDRAGRYVSMSLIPYHFCFVREQASEPTSDTDPTRAPRAFRVSDNNPKNKPSFALKKKRTSSQVTLLCRQNLHSARQCPSLEDRVCPEMLPPGKPDNKQSSWDDESYDFGDLHSADNT